MMRLICGSPFSVGREELKISCVLGFSIPIVRFHVCVNTNMWVTFYVKALFTDPSFVSNDTRNKINMNIVVDPRSHFHFEWTKNTMQGSNDKSKFHCECSNWKFMPA
jgi:hypothetical protein